MRVNRKKLKHIQIRERSLKRKRLKTGRVVTTENKVHEEE